MEILSEASAKERRDQKIRNLNLGFSLLTLIYALVVLVFNDPLSPSLTVSTLIIASFGTLNFLLNFFIKPSHWSQVSYFLLYVIQVMVVFLASLLSGGSTSYYIFLFPASLLAGPANLTKTRSLVLGGLVLCILSALYFMANPDLASAIGLRSFLGILLVSAVAFLFSTLIVQNYFNEEDEKLALSARLVKELAENERLAKEELAQAKKLNQAQRLSDIYRAVDSLRSVLNYETLESLIPYTLNGLFGFDQSFLFKEEKGELVLKSLAAEKTNESKIKEWISTCFEKERCFREIIDLGEIKAVTDLAEELKNSPSGTTWVKNEKLSQGVVIPLRIGTNLYGCLVAAKKGPLEEVDFLTNALGIFAITVVLALENANFYTRARVTNEQDNAILTQMTSGVCVTDKNNVITLLNNAAESLLGYEAKEVIGRKVNEVLLPFNNQGIKIPEEEDPICQANKQMDKSFTKDFFLQKKTGDRFPTSLSAKSIKDLDGNRIGVVIVFRDTTEEIEIEKTRNEFISIASHELRTPMTAIKGFLSMVIGNEVGKVPPKALEFLKMAQEGNERLIRLVEDLLNVSRIEGGRIKIEKQEVDLNETIKTVISDLLYHAGSNGVLINFAPTKNLPKVFADHDKLREVLINLVGNAIKYTNKGGKVIITQELSGWNVVTKVADTGIGIPKAEVPNLFKKFYRVPNEMTMKREGTGLGLYITKQIVELMGGEMKVESEFGKGSVFSFSLPVVEKDQKIFDNKPEVEVVTVRKGKKAKK